MIARLTKLFGPRPAPRPIRRLVAAMNDEDLAALSRVLADDLEFVDAHGKRILGKDSALEMAKRLFNAGIEYRMHVRSVARVGEQLLMRWTSSAKDPAFCKDLLWRVRISGCKIDFWETHGDRIERTLAEALVPELVEREAAA